jgi:hypothetical protein
MNKLKLCILTPALLLIINCGGGSENSSVAVTESPTINTPLPSNTEITTLLKDNPTSIVTAIKVFDNFALKISTIEVDMEGEFRFLKITDTRKKSLFLGQVGHQETINVPLNIVAESFPLTVEVFSELKTDETTSYEVTYD